MNYTGGPSISGCRPVLPLYPTHYFCQYLLGIFITFTNSSLFCRAFSTNSRRPLRLAAGGTLPGLNLSVTADAVPPPLPRGGFGIAENFSSSPEAPLLGELSSEARLRGCTKESPTVSRCWAQPLRHCFAMPPPLPRGGLGIAENFSSSPEAPLPGELSSEARLRGCTKESLTVSRCRAQPLRHG